MMALPAPALLLAKAYVLAGMTFCPPPDSPLQAEVVFKPEKTVYDYEVPVKELTSIAKKERKEEDTPRNSSFVVTHTMGMTKIKNWREFDFDFRYIKDKSGKACIYLSKTRVTLSHKTTVYIGKELKKYPCRLRVTQAHENRHVDIGRKAIEENLDEVRKTLQRAASRVPKTPLPARSIDARMQEVQDRIVAEIQKLMKKVAKISEKRQAVIDTPENYKYESGLCGQEKFRP